MQKTKQVIFFINIYGVSILVYLFLRIILRNSSLVAFCSNCIPLFLLPSFLILPLVVNKKNKFTRIWGGITLLFFLFEFGLRFIPFKNAISVPDYPQKILCVLSHNTGQDLPGYSLRDQVIIDSNADIVLLQEITADYIENHLAKFLTKYPYQYFGPLKKDGEKLVGMGILSKFPFLQQEYVKLDNNSVMDQLRVVVEIEGHRITIYNIHTTYPRFDSLPVPIFSNFSFLVYDDQIRRREIVALMKMVEEEKNPVILAGDFNMNDQAMDYKLLVKSGLVDSYNHVGYGFGFTWPANRTPSVNIRPAIPFIRVDYIFHSKDIKPITAYVMTETGSDHKPLLVNLSMPD